MNVTRIVDFYLSKIARRYDPENDAHQVTWAEKELVDAISDLIEHIIVLTDRVDTLEKALITATKDE